jgi:AspT/YidE/YbjL antiporter-like protein
MFTDLLHSSYFSLFLIVALGFMLGRIKIKGLSLDVSAVIFIALLFGHFGVIIPKELGNFGLVLFIFTIGIQAGPGFFDSFRSKGKTLILITMLIICSACLTAVGLKYAFDIDTPSVVGLIAGALTSTPGLAVAIDSTHSPLASIAYGIAYPFGVIGVILFVKLLPKIMRVNLDQEARRLEIERRGQFPELGTCIYRVTNASVFNRSLMQINARAMTGAVISRLKHKDEISIPTAHTVLHEGDYIQAVGSEESLNQLSVLIGESRMFSDYLMGDDASATITANTDGTVNLVYKSGSGDFILNNLTVSSKSFKGEGEVALAMEGSEPANYEYTLEGSVSDAKVLTLKANVPVPMGGIDINFIQAETPIAYYVAATYKYNTNLAISVMGSSYGSTEDCKAVIKRASETTVDITLNGFGNLTGGGNMNLGDFTISGVNVEKADDGNGFCLLCIVGIVVIVTARYKSE